MTTMRFVSRTLVTVTVIYLAGCGAGVSPNGPSSVSTTNMTWAIANAVSSTINLRFFDRTTGDVWPSSTTHWTVEAGKKQFYKLRCSKDSQICLGASPANNANYIWGVGLDNASGCEGCCHICGSGDPTPVSLTTR